MNRTHDIVAYLEQLADDVKEEKADAIEALATLRFVTKAVGAASKIIDPIAIEVASKHPKSFFHAGLQWTYRDGSRKVDYSDNPIIKALQDDMDLEKKKADAATKMLENMRGKVDESGYVYNEDGVQIGYPAKISYTKPSLILHGQ